MSSKHFEIENRSNEIILRDLGSRNGTKLNDSTVSGELPIADRSQVQAGHTVFAIAWESREEDWQTQLSSASMRRSALLSGSGSALFPRTSSSGYMNGGSGIASSVEGKGNGSSFVHSPEERVARAFLEVFHIGNLTGASGTPRVFERLYIPIDPTNTDSNRKIFPLEDFDFFAVINFCRLGVQPPPDIEWFPSFPDEDRTAATTPVVVTKRVWQERIRNNWLEKLVSVDGVIFLLADSTESPEWCAGRMNQGYRTALCSAVKRESQAIVSTHTRAGVQPWYSPTNLLMLIGTRTDVELSEWDHPKLRGIVFPHQASRMTFALSRADYSERLKANGFFHVA